MEYQFDRTHLGESSLPIIQGCFHGKTAQAQDKKVWSQGDPERGEAAMHPNMPRLPEMKKIRNPNNTYSLANQIAQDVPCEMISLLLQESHCNS